MSKIITPEFETQTTGFLNYITNIEHPFLWELMYRTYPNGAVMIKQRCFDLLDGIVSISLSCYDDCVHLDLIEVVPKERGKGHATRYMQMLTDISDTVQIPIVLRPGGLTGRKAKYGIPERKLPAFYKKFGFVKPKDKELSNMTYTPKVLA